jgi:Ca-activated chloride channel family protein
MKLSTALLAVSLAASSVACAGSQRRGPPADLVALDATLGNRFLPATEASDVVARIRVRVPEAATLRRPPMNLSLVVDTSGSMEGRAIEDARTAGVALLDSLRDGDRLAVVTFDSRAAVLLPSTVLDGDSRGEARRRLLGLRAQGTTAMAEGLRLGVLEVMGHHDPAGINRVVLLGDGVPNERADIEALAASAGARGVSITALGLGLDYDESLMGAVAQRSGGHFHYVADSAQVAQVFRDEVLRMERVVGRNAVAVITPGPGVEVRGVIGHDATRTAQGVTLALGDVTEGSSRDVIVRLRAPSRRAGAAVELLDVSLSYDDAVQGAGRVERRTFLGARTTADATERESGRDEEVERASARVQLAAGTLAAIRDARTGNVAQAQADLDALLDAALQRARRDRDVTLERRVTNLRALRPALASVAPAAQTAEAAPAVAVRAAHDEAMSVIEGE